MKRAIILVIVTAVLLIGLAGVTYAGYNGFGLVSGGGPSARVGSIGGPVVIGGGPGSGK